MKPGARYRSVDWPAGATDSTASWNATSMAAPVQASLPQHLFRLMIYSQVCHSRTALKCLESCAEKTCGKRQFPSGFVSLPALQLMSPLGGCAIGMANLGGG